jgi:phenylalanine-4-hydroxylase
VTPRAFLEGLAHRSMLSTQYIRHHSVPEYTPEPDVIHEILGHAVFLADKEYALVNELFGRVATLSTDDQINQLIALYWHTIEFGICYEGGQIKAYGAGLLSSVGEMKRIATVPRLPFDVHVMEETEFNTTHFQSRLFCAESYGYAMAELRSYLTDLYEIRKRT